MLYVSVLCQQGVWLPPPIKNPACVSTPGCGPWKSPLVSNTNYKGPWIPPQVKNPRYKVGVCVCVGGGGKPVCRHKECINREMSQWKGNAKY
jgi:hypothetical protein